MKSILITGGAGFIGSTLAENLLLKKKKIILLDNFNDYYDPKIKERNIKEIKERMGKEDIPRENLLLYREDIRNKEKIKSIFENHEIEMVIHLAAMAGVRYSIENPALYYDVNINGTLNLLEACKKEKIKKFIFASSSSVYGNNTKVPFEEKDPVDYPISPYGATKRGGELLCYTYHHLYDISIAALRFFTVYGPRQRPDLAIHKFAKSIVEKQEIPFYGDGSTKRDYTYIEDIIQGILKAMDWIKENKKRYEIFNLGESKTISLGEMVQIIEKVLEKKAHKKILPMQPGDVLSTHADINKAKEILGYNPKMDFEEGIKNFIQWMK